MTYILISFAVQNSAATLHLEEDRFACKPFWLICAVLKGGWYFWDVIMEGWRDNLILEVNLELYAS